MQLSGSIDDIDLAVTAGVGITSRIWDARGMPWIPELFSAPARQQLLDKRRREKLVAVPYFDGLLSGEPDALLESFAGEPEVYDPVRGRIKGAHRSRRSSPTRGSGSRSATPRSRTSSTSSSSDAALKRWFCTSTMRPAESIFRS